MSDDDSHVGELRRSDDGSFCSGESRGRRERHSVSMRKDPGRWIRSHPIGTLLAAVAGLGGILGVVYITGGVSAALSEGTTQLRKAVETATGLPGLGIVFAYSFLIAFVLPLPSELVLAAPLELGLAEVPRFTVIVLISGVGKAAGSLVALRAGMAARESGPVTRALDRLGFDVVEWSERKSTTLAQRYGYGGMALALSIPFFPDTASIYAFSVLESDYGKFAVASFVGSVGRLLITVLFLKGTVGL